MSPDTKLVLVVGGMHLLGLGLVTVLLVMFLRSDTAEPWTPEDGEDGGGGGTEPLPADPPSRPGGGLPLPDAMPARVRLRDPSRLGDLLPRRERRPAREPEREPGRLPG